MAMAKWHVGPDVHVQFVDASSDIESAGTSMAYDVLFPARSATSAGPVTTITSRAQECVERKDPCASTGRVVERPDWVHVEQPASKKASKAMPVSRIKRCLSRRT